MGKSVAHLIRVAAYMLWESRLLILLDLWTVWHGQVSCLFACLLPMLWESWLFI